VDVKSWCSAFIVFVHHTSTRAVMLAQVYQGSVTQNAFLCMVLVV